MTARTHDLAAFTMLTLAVTKLGVPPMPVLTAVAAIGANMLGGLGPDIDESTAEIWRKIRGGSLLATLVRPLLGGHRLLSHSLIGMVLIGWLLKWALSALAEVVLIDMEIIWWSFMLGYFSHLVMDSLTKEGVPWLFPIPWGIGLPPFRFLRLKTGGLIEKSFIFPGLILLNAYLIYTHKEAVVVFFGALGG